MLDVDIIEINDEQAHSAKLLSSALSNPQIRKRGMIDMLGINCAINYLYAKKIRINTKRSVYKIPLLFEEFKITDIYYGNYRVDVITLYKEKTIKIPKIHVDMDILPNFYFVVQIGSKIKEAKMIGFIDAKKITSCSSDSKFYYPTLDMIFDVKKFLSITRHSLPSKNLLGKHTDCMGLFLKFIDNDLSSVYKRQLIQHLMNCDSCRSKFIDTVEFEKLANNIRFYPELIRKSELKKQIPDISKDIQHQGDFVSFEDGINNIEIEYDSQEKFAQDDFQEEVDRSYKPKTAEMFDIEDKRKKKVIETIFNEIPKIELPQIKTVMTTKNRRIFLIGILIFFVLAGFVLISFKGSSDLEAQGDEFSTYNEEYETYNDYDSYDNYDNYGDGKAKLITKEKNIEDFTIQQPISTKPKYTPSVDKISWEIGESLAKKESYVKYLQLIGKNVKLNLQNDLLLVKDIPDNKTVAVDIQIASNGEVNSIKISKSSGSEQIDASINKIITETLTYMKPPSLGVLSKPANVTLSINLN